MNSSKITTLKELIEKAGLEREDYYGIKGRLSNSTFKYFRECSARAYAVQEGEHIRPFSSALVHGSYVDELLFETFQTVDTSSLYTLKGELRSDAKYLKTIVQEIKDDEGFWRYLKGDYQQQKLFEIEGVPWKGKLDVLPYEFDNMIVDFKTAKSIDDWAYSERFQQRIPFYYARGYDIQGAVYTHAWEKERFVLAIATKMTPSGRYIIELPREMLDKAMDYVIQYQELVFDQMQGRKLEFCGNESCEYCRSRKPTILNMAPVISARGESPF